MSLRHQDRSHDRAVASRILTKHLEVPSGDRSAGRIFRIGHLGDINDLTLIAALAGVEMALGLAGVPHERGGVQAAMDFLRETA